MPETKGNGLGTQVAELFERRVKLVLLFLLGLYFLTAYSQAAARPLWFDELLTVHISRLPDLGEVWDALLDATDSQPPLTYVLVRWAQSLLGETEVAARLPSVIFFGVFSISLYWLLAPRMGKLLAIAGMLFAWNTGAFHYAQEARPYAALLGCCGVALLCWRAAIEGRYRKTALTGLAVSVAAGISSHYYGVFLCAPIGVGELVRCFRRKLIDWPIWLSLFAAASITLAYLPLIDASRAAHGGEFWSPVRLSQIGTSYDLVMPPAFVVALLLVVAVAGRPGGRSFSNEVFGPWPELPVHEWVALGFLALFPVFAVPLAMLSTGIWVERYGLIAAIGVCAMFAVLIRRLAGGDARRLLGVVFVLFVFFFYFSARPALSNLLWPSSSHREQLAEKFAPIEIPNGVPIVSDYALTHLELRAYAPAEMAHRWFYLTGSTAAGGPLDHSYLNSFLTRLNKRAPIGVEPYDLFIKEHKEFVVYSDIYNRGWLVKKLNEQGHRLEVIATGPEFLMLKCCGEVTYPPATPNRNGGSGVAAAARNSGR